MERFFIVILLTLASFLDMFTQLTLDQIHLNYWKYSTIYHRSIL